MGTSKQYSSVYASEQDAQDDHSDSVHRGNPHKQTSSLASTFKPGSWTLEVCTLIFGLLTLGAIVGLLIWINDQPYFETWQTRVPLLSINSILAILSAALTASTLHAVNSAIGQWKWIEYRTKQRPLKLWDIYDDCSRGPMGAFESLYRLPLSALLLGALATLGGLAVSSFIQQTVVLEPRYVTKADDRVFMRFATEYNTRPHESLFGGYYSEVQDRDQGMRGAILRGIYGLPTETAFECGGACGWPGMHQTIAFTSACTNVTQATKINCRSGTCNMTTPGGVYLQSKHVATDSGTMLALNTTVDGVFEYARNKFDPETGAGSVPVPADILHIAILRIGAYYDGKSYPETPVLQDITECTLSLVSREFHDIKTNGTSFTPGKIVDRPLGQGYFTKGDAGQAGQVDDGVKHETAVISYSDAADGSKLASDISIGMMDLWNIFMYFQTTMMSSSIVAGTESGGKPAESGGAVGAFLKTFKGSRTDYPGAPPAIESVGNIVKDMTDAMSEYVRDQTPSSQAATGFDVRQVVYAVVDWYFVIYPLAWEVIAIFFVFSVMFTNRRRKIPLWKNSAIAMIMHSYDGEQMVLSGSQPMEMRARHPRAAI